MPVTAHCSTFFGSDLGYGWSESHELIIATPVGDLLPILQSYKTLIDGFRKPLLGADRYVKGLRISYPTPAGSIGSTAYMYSPVAYPSNKRDGCSPMVAAQCRMGDASNQNFSNLFLRGFWDDVEVNQELNFGTATGAAWKGLLDQFIAALVQGQYGWEAIDDALTIRGTISSYTTDLNGLVTFTLTPNPGPPALTPGETVNFRAARLNGGHSVLNRTLICRAITSTTVRTVNPIACAAFESEGTFVIRYTAFTAYTGMQYAKLARRAEGRPTGLSRGRAKARART